MHRPPHGRPLCGVFVCAFDVDAARIREQVQHLSYCHVSIAISSISAYIDSIMVIRSSVLPLLVSFACSISKDATWDDGVTSNPVPGMQGAARLPWPDVALM